MIKNYNNYGETAIKSVKKFKITDTISDVWKETAKDIFETKNAREKNCPKSAFLGLCEEGLVKNIPKGNYTNSKLNKQYAIIALKIISYTPTLSKKQLWNRVKETMLLGDKSHNSQMDVVLALWKNNLIIK